MSTEMAAPVGPENLREQEAELRRQVEQLLDEARRQGADDAEVSVDRSLGLAVSVRQDELETVESTRDAGFGVTVYRDGRKGSASTTVVDAHAVRDTVAKALQIARETEVDPAAGIAPPESVCRDPVDLDLHHPWSLSVAEAEALARACERAARADPRISNTEGASTSTFQSCRAYGNTSGFLGSECGTRHALSVSVIAGAGSDMQRDYWYTGSRLPERLDSAEAVGRRAAERTIARLGARPVATGKVPVLFSAEVAAGLISHFLGAISGGALYRRASFLCDALGEQLFPERMRIEEHPLIPRAVGSAAFDGDGVGTRAKAFVEAGVLSSYLLSVYSARRLGMETTGNSGGVHNLVVSNDGHDSEAMIRALDRGLLVTELMGQGVNAVTGDYSRGAAGFWVEGGECVHPVAEVTVAGSLREMFRSIRLIGDDALPERNVSCGSILVDGMTLAGA